ncbi:MAG: ABC transporter permease [Gemmatimonadota bacterium]|nr:MAG: ABC transporter permease [Gemmatimonadota bacterium]
MLSSSLRALRLWDRVRVPLDDLRFAIRTLRRNTGFTVTVVLTLALGIGANTGVFSVVNGIILKPLPYNDPDRLVMVYVARADRGWTRGSMSQPDLRSVQSEARSIQAAAGYYATELALTGLGAAESVPGAVVTDGLLAVFQEPAFLGRDLRGEENVPGGPRVVVIAHSFWQERLGGDREALGRTLQISGEPHEIVGVAPPRFDYPQGAQLWVPAYLNVEGCGRDCHFLQVIARLAEGTSFHVAAGEAVELSRRLEGRYPVLNYGKRFNVITLEQDVVGDVRTALWVLLGAVGIVLLIACANIANLLLARATSRSHEVATRSALGATRRRIVLQLLLEALLLASLAGLVGLVIASWTVSLLLSIAPATIPLLDQVTIDGMVLLYTLVVVVVITVLFGLTPSLWLARVPVTEALSQGGRTGSGGPARRRSRSALLVAQVALSLMLLLGAGLLLRSFARLNAVQLGFEKEDVLTFRLVLPSDPYDYDVGRTERFFASLEDRVRGLPGVDAVASVYGSPLAGYGVATSIHFLDRAPPPEGQEDDITVRVVTPGYHDALRIPVVHGRRLGIGDRDGATRVALVSQSLSDRYYPDQDPVGRRIRIDMNLGYGSADPWTIVGVVGDIRSQNLRDKPEPEIYVPHAQMGSRVMSVLVRLRPGVDNVLPAIRGEVQALDSNVPIRSAEMLEETVGRQLGPARFYLLLLAFFAAVAVALAGIGLYGVIAYLASRRTREIGIRIALGAKSGDIRLMVVSEGVALALLGVALGLIGAYAGARVLRSLLYEVEPADPLAFVGATALLLGVVALAVTLPARRASSVDPVDALKSE